MILSAGIIRKSVGTSAQSNYRVSSADRDNVHKLNELHLISRPVNSVGD